jgi:hypothetical protein
MQWIRRVFFFFDLDERSIGLMHAMYMSLFWLDDNDDDLMNEYFR